METRGSLSDAGGPFAAGPGSTLKDQSGNQCSAAKILGIHRNTLRRAIRALEIDIVKKLIPTAEMSKISLLYLSYSNF